MSSPKAPAQTEVLFRQNPADGSFKTWREIESNSTAPVFPAVKIVDRAYHLIQALNAFGQASKREQGFQVAVDIEPHRQKIYNRYGGKTAQVVNGAQRRAETFKNQAKIHFWQATGLAALAGLEIVPEHVFSDREAKARANQFYNDFYGKYYGPAHYEAMNKQRNRQINIRKKFLKLSQQLVQNSDAQQN